VTTPLKGGLARQTLEQEWADDESATEDLRITLRRYGTSFERLLSLAWPILHRTMD